MRQDILSVSELLKEMKETINQNERLSNVALIGEVSNFSAHRSGHFYFSLKDEAARMSCVMFKGAANSVLFEPKAGDKVILVGHVGVFEASGSVQFYASKMILDGLGQLHQQYEKLKLDYQTKGYFDESRKRPIAPYPKSIVLITGQGSAAYADMVKTIHQRWPLVQVLVLYSLVQGDQAKHQIVANINHAQSLGVDTIVLARGGGSIEDLWAFNEPEVVEAIAASTVPIVTGIGHESDTTLSDLVADLRAATPTAAIVATLPSQIDVTARIRAYMNQYYLAVRRSLRTQQAKYNHIMDKSLIQDPQRLIDRKAHVLDYHKQSLNQALKRFDDVKRQVQDFELQSAHQLHQRLSNHRIYLERVDDYLIQKTDYNIASEHTHLDQLDLTFRHRLDHQAFVLKESIEGMAHHHEHLLALGIKQVQLKQRAFTDIMKVMNSLSPFAIMAKGYALTYHDGTIVKSIDSIQIEDAITVQYKDGQVEATVIRKDKSI